MLYRLLCNDVQREGDKPGPGLASELFSYAPLHNIGYGIGPLLVRICLLTYSIHIDIIGFLRFLDDC